MHTTEAEWNGVDFAVNNAGAGTILGVAPAAAATSFLEKNAMSNPTRIYEPLTCENAALVLIDHQIGLMTGVRDYSIAELKHNVVGLAKAAKTLKVPIIVTTTARDSMWGPTFPELVEALPGVQIIDRSSVNAFDDARVAHAIDTTGRRKLVFAGLSLEVCAAFPAITAVNRGLDAYVAVDACGTFSETKRQVGLLRMMQAGVILSDYATLMIEVLKDNVRPEAGAVYAAIEMDWATLVGQIAQANWRRSLQAGRLIAAPACPQMATASDVAVQGNVGLLVNCGSGLRVLEASKMHVRPSRLRLTPRVTAMRSERGR